MDRFLNGLRAVNKLVMWWAVFTFIIALILAYFYPEKMKDNVWMWWTTMGLLVVDSFLGTFIRGASNE